MMPAGMRSGETRRFIGQVTLMVRDHDEALSFYVGKMGFTAVEDSLIADGRRRVVVSPGGLGAQLVLVKAATPEQLSRVGSQTGGRVFLFLHTDDCQGDYELLADRGVKFTKKPEATPHGTVAVIEDLYGNLIDLIQAVERE